MGLLISSILNNNNNNNNNNKSNSNNNNKNKNNINNGHVTSLLIYWLARLMTDQIIPNFIS